MSVTTQGKRFPLCEAEVIAARVKTALTPFCERIEIAGSIRQKKDLIGDLEIVCVPLQAPSDLFGEVSVAHHGFCSAVNRWPAVKGQPTEKYTQCRLPEGITLDPFIADADNWGWQLALWTGSAAYSHLVLAMGLWRAG